MTIPNTMVPAAEAVSREERWLGRGLAAAPFALLGLAFVVTLAVGGRVVEPDRLPWLIAATSMALGLRLWLLRGGSRREQVTGFVANLILTLV